MRLTARKSAPGVRDGTTQKKNRTTVSPDVYVHEFDSLVVQRIRPAKGFYHAVTPTDIRRFVRLIPDWARVAEQVKAVILTPGGDDCYGRYNNAGIIKLDAWPKNEPVFVPARKGWLLSSIGVDHASGLVSLQPKQAKCFLLMGTFLHELGHHVDRVNTRSRADATNGEPFAIAYEHRVQQELWPAYCCEFGTP
jgi:hypothetical protein